jgi:hypothetical protein
MSIGYMLWCLSVAVDFNSCAGEEPIALARHGQNTQRGLQTTGGV